MVPSTDSLSWGRRDIGDLVMREVLRKKMSKELKGMGAGDRGLRPVGFRDNFLSAGHFSRALKDGRIWESHMEEACGKLGPFRGTVAGR